MADCQRPSSETYLNYKCYEYLKPRFHEIRLGDNGPKYLAKAKEQIERNHSNIQQYESFFKNIASHLNRSGIFYDADRRVACSYINYLLNKKLIESNMYLSNSNYGILKDFVREYHISQQSSQEDANICSSEIKLLDYKDYIKMKLLYDLYDEYITLIQPYHLPTYNPCDVLGKIISLYNESMKGNQITDEKLINKLIEFKQLIGNNVLPKNTKCQKNIEHFSLSKKEQSKIEEENQRKIEEQRIKQEKEQLEQEQQQLAQEKQRLEQQNLDLERQQRQGKPELVRPELYEQEGEHGRLSQDPEQQLTYEQGPHYRGPYIQPPSSPHIRESRLDGSYNDLQSIGDSGPSGVKIEQLQDQGVLGQMQNAFSSIVQNVDPAPVLGLSGGMGVLFILFKYTPFGSFFGGRRGRFRQIPSFRGLSPGEIPNFHEYGGGYVGYSPMDMPFQGE
ncbi:VIR protein [Plasmodium vivax]|uniref:VIR protein n=1 Tax=Plasmodium vivax TaxID=5855 RepID=A0A1G4E8L8_PLAVI|nr:VIR protein [Plasmodium vivax]